MGERLSALHIPVATVVAQHAEDTAVLRDTRSVLVRAPQVKLLHLRRLDERLIAHLDGLRIAGEFGAEVARAALDPPTAGAVFATAVTALEAGDAARFQQDIALARGTPDAERGLVSALGWVSAASLRQTVAAWLASSDSFLRRLGLAASRLHRVDPGTVLEKLLTAEDAPVQAEALRACGELGRTDLAPACVAMIDEEAVAVQFHTVRSALLLGERGRVLQRAFALALLPAPHRDAAIVMALLASDTTQARGLLEQLAKQRDEEKPETLRTLIRAVAYAGDPYYADWLLQVMQDQKLARIAGESFSFITGADLAWLDLERKPPEEPVAGPNDNPDDDDVALDEDDDLPWPDTERVRNWWSKHASEFRPGTRYLVGAPPAPGHCIRILREGTQRQRYAAAVTLCLLRPGTQLFNIAAPAWRQQRLLAAMR